MDSSPLSSRPGSFLSMDILSAIPSSVLETIAAGGGKRLSFLQKQKDRVRWFRPVTRCYTLLLRGTNAAVTFKLMPATVVLWLW